MRATTRINMRKKYKVKRSILKRKLVLSSSGSCVSSHQSLRMSWFYFMKVDRVGTYILVSFRMNLYAHICNDKLFII